MKKGKQGDGGGRPTIVFDDEQIKQVEILASVLSKAQLAAYFDISERSLLYIEKRQPDVFAAYHRGRAKAIAKVGQGVIQRAIAGSTADAKLYLSTQAGWKQTHVVETTEQIASNRHFVE